MSISPPRTCVNIRATVSSVLVKPLEQELQTALAYEIEKTSPNTAECGENELKSAIFCSKKHQIGPKSTEN